MLTVLPDFREEGWHSMDLCAEKLLENFPLGKPIEACIPKFRRLSGWLPFKKSRNFDRWFNRWVVYPRHVKTLAKRPGFFHLVDHSYSHLLHQLPLRSAGVYCHDLDAFRSILMPSLDPRPVWYRRMMGNVFSGFKRAKVVFCNSEVTRNEILGLGIWSDSDVVLAPLGVSGEFVPEGPKVGGNFILHVGSCIPRKRIDLLLDIFNLVRRTIPSLKLVQAGGTFTVNQLDQIRSLGLSDAVDQVRNLTREELARLYRGSKALLITSDSEGFGLPVIEGLACGSKVVATNIPALLEAGGKNVFYFPAGNSVAGNDAVLEALHSPGTGDGASVAVRKIHCWKNYAGIISETYANLK